MLKNCTVQHVFFPLDLKKTKKNKKKKSEEWRNNYSSFFTLHS